MAFDVSALTSKEQVTLIYIGYYDRAPDPEGLNFWETQLEEFFNGDADGVPGNSLAEIATLFSDQDETREVYDFFDPDSTVSPGAFVSNVYINLFGRLPDPEGLNFWTGVLEAGELPVGEVILEIIGGAKGSDIAVLENKLEVAIDWHDTALANEALIPNEEEGASAASVLDGVTDDPATAIAAKDETADFFASDEAFVLTASAAAVDEGDAVTFTLATENVDAGSTFNYEITGVSGDDIGSSLTGSVTLDSNGEAIINVGTVADEITEGEETLTLSVAGETADVTVNDTSLTPPPPQQPSTIFLKPGPESVTVQDGQTVVGDENTFDDADEIVGLSGTVDLFLTNTTESGTLDNLDEVNIHPDGTVFVNAEDWTDIDQINIIEPDDNTDFEISEIQGSVPSIHHDDVETGSVITTHYDGQDLNANANTVDQSVREFEGTLLIRTDDNSAVETINLTVDDTAGFESKMADLSGEKEDGAGGWEPTTETLNISGGELGIPFEITGALDPTLTEINAAGLLSDASLNVTESTETMSVAFGPGDDVLYVGDTLFDDDIDGGGGNNRVVAEFDDTTTRTPTMNNVQTLEATFGASVTVDASNIDDLVTLELNASSGRADLNNVDQTFTNVDILGNLAQGVEIDYDGSAPASTTFTILEDTTAIGNAGNDSGIRVIDANEVTISHEGNQDVVISNGIQVDDSFGPGQQATTDVTIQNTVDSDLAILQNTSAPNSPTVIADGNLVQRLSIVSTSTGNITLPPGLAANSATLMAEAGALQHFLVSAANNSNITTGVVGDENGGDAATDLETVTITAGIGSNLQIGQIDGDDSGRATVDNATIAAGRDATILLAGDGGDASFLEAGSINEMNVFADNGALVSGEDSAGVTVGGIATQRPNFAAESLIGLEIQSQSSNSVLTVSGEGSVTGFVFDRDNFATVDATGLEGSGLTVVHAEPNNATGFTFLGSNQADEVLATNEGDLLVGNGGDDRLIGLGGNDVIEGNGGDDILWGDADDSVQVVTQNDNRTVSDQDANQGPGVFGNDVIDGGAGNDYIAGNANALPVTSSSIQDILNGAIGDVLTGGTGNDTFYFDIGIADPLFDTGKSTANSDVAGGLMQDVITDFSAAGDTIEFGFDGAPLPSYQIVKYDDNTASFTAGGTPGGPVALVLRTGEYNADGTFNQTSEGDDLQLLVNQEFTPFSVFSTPPFLDDGGGSAFAEADFEIGLLGAANQIGSIDDTDFIFS